MQHEASAHLSISRSGRLYLASLQGLERALSPQHAAAVVARPLVSGLRLLGLDLVRRDGLELLEHLLRRGLIAGATDMSDYLEGAIVDHLFRNTAIFAAPANAYVALYTTSPTDADAGTELSGGGYARQAVGTSGGWSGIAGSSATDNAAAIDFGSATANWGTVTHVGLRDALTLGNLLLWGALSAAKTVNSGDSFQFAAGNLDISFD